MHATPASIVYIVYNSLTQRQRNRSSRGSTKPPLLFQLDYNPTNLNGKKNTATQHRQQSSPLFCPHRRRVETFIRQRIQWQVSCVKHFFKKVSRIYFSRFFGILFSSTLTLRLSPEKLIGKCIHIICKFIFVILLNLKKKTISIINTRNLNGRKKSWSVMLFEPSSIDIFPKVKFRLLW